MPTLCVCLFCIDGVYALVPEKVGSYTNKVTFLHRLACTQGIPGWPTEQSSDSGLGYLAQVAGLGSLVAVMAMPERV